MKFKKILKNKAIWIISLTLFGLILGIPFFMNGKAWLIELWDLELWQKLGIITTTFLIGIFTEDYLRRSKLL